MLIENDFSMWFFYCWGEFEGSCMLKWWRLIFIKIRIKEGDNGG